MFKIILTEKSVGVEPCNPLEVILNEFCPEGALNFFQVGVCGPDFRSVGLAN